VQLDKYKIQHFYVHIAKRRRIISAKRIPEGYLNQLL